jgi:23S rRNA maturation mini-RNase III
MKSANTNFSKNIARQISDDVLAIWSDRVYEKMLNEYYFCGYHVDHSEFARSHMQQVVWDMIGKVQEYEF